MVFYKPAIVDMPKRWHLCIEARAILKSHENDYF